MLHGFFFFFFMALSSMVCSSKSKYLLGPTKKATREYNKAHEYGLWCSWLSHAFGVSVGILEGGVG